MKIQILQNNLCENITCPECEETFRIDAGPWPAVGFGEWCCEDCLRNHNALLHMSWIEMKKRIAYRQAQQ